MDEDFHRRLVRHGLDAVRQIAAVPPLAPRARRFLFLRHGQTEGNARRIYQAPETALNDTGVAQARRAAAILAGQAVAEVVASDMRRAWHTAEIAAQAVGAPLRAEPNLRERWFGDLIGTSSAGLDWRNEPPNGETLADFVARTRAGISAALDTPHSPLLVGHGGTLYVLVFGLGLDLQPEFIDNATPIAFEFGAGRWRARALLAPAPLADPAMPS